MSKEQKAAKKYALYKVREIATVGMNNVEMLALDYYNVTHAYLDGWNECDKQPIVLTTKQVQDILCAAVNCPQDTRAETHKRRFEEALNDR